METITKKAKGLKPMVWSRKGTCPSCGVGCGSKHNKNCKLVYKRFSIKDDKKIVNLIKELNEKIEIMRITTGNFSGLDKSEVFGFGYMVALNDLKFIK
jgi:hypothetical protein